MDEGPAQQDCPPSELWTMNFDGENASLVIEIVLVEHRSAAA